MKQQNAMKQSLRLAFCGVLAALSIVLLFLSGVIPVATIALPALAGCVLIPVVAECGEKWGMAVFTVTVVGSFFLAAEREAFLLYLLFFGYYPVLFAVLERVRKAWLRWGIKLLVFNVAAVTEGWIVTFVLGVPIESLAFLGAFAPVVLLLLANLVFLVYDFAFCRLLATYFTRLHATAQRMLGRR